ncbi:unnamed protein product [Rotaria socialis]|uniref:ABC transporter domain-containing protein n=1 Tax=Rotaria socialis TaxID=392032 RepID=A0A820U0D6_9BILA|nr:unnamed protein product [Rotaria socialis]CAF4479212.1 unnamed protein product [Rotaria socialis]
MVDMTTSNIFNDNNQTAVWFDLSTTTVLPSSIAWTDSPVTSNITMTTPKNSSPLSSGAIAAIVICSIIAGVVVIISGYFLYRYRSKINKICREKLNLKAEAEEVEDDDDDEDEHRPSRRDLVMRRSNITRTSGSSTRRTPIPSSRLSLRSDGNNQPAPVSLSFHNINYTVESGNSQSCNVSFSGGRKHQRNRTKQVLFDVSGQFRPGMNALLGPTGCGKSSLLDILAARKDPRGLSGRVLVDGLPLPSSFKYMVGYVVQDDIISGTLTVRENLIFSANVRLPTSVSQEERQDRVNRIITQLGLEACADTRIGTEFLRGVSGGERKRACIGMELVLSPKILFLDEPTTGLDASTASNVMNCLHRLSRQGCTIIFSIHQPRFSIFNLFDTTVLLCKGKCIYQGSPNQLVKYFASQSYQCHKHDNPADFALDVLIQASKTKESLRKLTRAYITSPMHARMEELVADLDPNEDEIYGVNDERPDAEHRSFRSEIYYVAQRTLKNAIRNPQLALSQTVVAVVLGFLVGLVFYDMELTRERGVQNRLGAIFFITVSQVFSTVTALEPLLKERVLFIHENVSGYYRTSTFFIAKLVCDILPMRVVPSVIFSIIAYFMSGLHRTAGQYFVFLLTIFMSTVFGSALCFLAAACIPMFAVALISVVLVFVIMMVFSGFLVDLATVFGWLSWIQWISAFRYSSNVLTISEFRNLTFCETKNMSCLFPLTGEQVLDSRDLSHATDWDMWKHFLALTGMAVFYLILAYIQLVRIKKTK